MPAPSRRLQMGRLAMALWCRDRAGRRRRVYCSVLWCCFAACPSSPSGEQPSCHLRISARASIPSTACSRLSRLPCPRPASWRHLPRGCAIDQAGPARACCYLSPLRDLSAYTRLWRWSIRQARTRPTFCSPPYRASCSLRDCLRPYWACKSPPSPVSRPGSYLCWSSS